MSLHYLVKLEILVRHVLPLSCNRKKLPNLSHLNCVFQIRQIWIQLITACEDYCKGMCESMHQWSGRTETATENRVGPAGPSSLQQPFISGVVDSSRSVMRVLYTFCCNTLLSTGFKSSQSGGHSWGGINQFHLVTEERCAMSDVKYMGVHDVRQPVITLSGVHGDKLNKLL